MKISSLREFVENKSDIITMACFRLWHKSTNIYAETCKIAITSDQLWFQENRPIHKKGVSHDPVYTFSFQGWHFPMGLNYLQKPYEIQA